MTTTFHLRNPQRGVLPKDQRVTPIEMAYHFEGKRLRAGIGESILPRDWNPETQRPRKNAPNSGALTKLLDRMATRVKDIHLNMKADFATVTPGAIRTALDRDTKNGGKKLTFVQYFARYIDDKAKANGEKSVGMFNSTLNSLKKYPGGKDFDDITSAWFEKYVTWMENYRDKHMPEGYSANYIVRQVGILREVVSAARREGLHRNDKYTPGDYKVAYEDTDAIFLTYDELLALSRVELSPAKDNVRNRFLIGAFTLLRFSDYTKITATDIRDGLIYNKNQKTGTSVVVPQHWIVGEIMAKYPDGIPPIISNQKSNVYIKKICREAGITTPITVHKTKGGKVLTTSIDKCDLVTTHTARRSGACNMELSGIPRSMIMTMGGWKTEAAYLHYIRYKAIDSARTMQNHAFFTLPALPGSTDGTATQ